MNSLKVIFDRDTWQEIFGSISKNKTRTVITVIGVLWGIFIYIALSGAAKGLDNGFHVVRITNLDQSLDPARLEYQIYNENDLNSREHSGFVDDPDVYGVVGSNVSFHDRDAGYSVTQGDYFVIDSETIGSKDGTWSMKLIDQSSNRLLFDVKLILIED